MFNNYFADFLKKFEMNFKNLQHSVPEGIVTKKGVSIDFINDDLVKSMDKKKYDFYVQFMAEIDKNPENFKKVLYEYKLIKNDQEKLDKLLDDIAKQYNKIFSVTDMNALANENIYNAIMNDKKENEGTKLKEFESTIEKKYIGEGVHDTNKIFNLTGGGDGDGDDLRKLNEKKQEIQSRKMKYLDNIQKYKDIYKKDQILSTYNDKIDTVMNDENVMSDYKKANMVKNVIDEIEDEDNRYSINQLYISKEDKLVFIGVTFLIRLLALSLVDWSLKTNYVVSFTDAFLMYIFLYTVFIIFIIVIVNISYNMPLSQIYSSDSTILSKLSGTLYYFYLIPGQRLQNSGRILFHLGLLYFVTIVSIIIKQTRKRNYDEKDQFERYDYSYKREVRNTLSSFTLTAWIFLSFLVIM